MDRKTEYARALLTACVCVLVWAFVGLAVPDTFRELFQAAAVLAAAHAAGLSRADCGLQLPKRSTFKLTLCFAAAAAAFAAVFPVQIAEEPSAAAYLKLCLAAPLAEELAFRGAVLGALKPFGRTGTVLQAAMFALLHGSPTQKLYAFVMGLLFGEMTRRAESIWPSAVLHAANNTLVFLWSLWRTIG